MAQELSFGDEAAAEYDRAFARVSGHFLPFLFAAANLSKDMQVLDIAAGTGLGADEVLDIVGPAGHVTAADVSAPMVERAKAHLASRSNASAVVEDGQRLTFAPETFDAIICSLGLMFFPDPSRGVSEFRRVLRPGARAAASVLTVPERPTMGASTSSLPSMRRVWLKPRRVRSRSAMKAGCGRCSRMPDSSTSRSRRRAAGSSFHRSMHTMDLSSAAAAPRDRRSQRSRRTKGRPSGRRSAGPWATTGAGSDRRRIHDRQWT